MRNMEGVIGFKVAHFNGRVERFDSYNEAEECVRKAYGEHVVIGHDGDISEGGESTLCWWNEASSIDDAGERSCAKISKQHESR